MLWECVINIRDTFFIENVRDRVGLPHLSVVDIGGDHRQLRHDWGFENFNGGFSASRALSALQIWRGYTSIKRDRAWCGLLDAHRIGWPSAFQDSLIFVAVAIGFFCVDVRLSSLLYELFKATASAHALSKLVDVSYAGGPPIGQTNLVACKRREHRVVIIERLA